MSNWIKTFKDAPLNSIFSYVQGNIRMLQDKFGENFISLPPHIQEQIVYRQEHSKCSNLPECTVCGCAIPGLFYADKACKGGCYPAMMSEAEWNKFKEEGYQPIPFEDTEIQGSDIFVEGFKNEVKQVFFKVKNIGKHPFRLDRITVSCGCTVPSWEKGTIIPSGEEKEFVANITLSADTMKYLFVNGNANILKLTINRKINEA